MSMGFPGNTSGKEPAYQCRRLKRHKFNPLVGKIPQRRAWQPSPVFLPGNPVNRGGWWAMGHRITKSYLEHMLPLHSSLETLPSSSSKSLSMSCAHSLLDGGSHPVHPQVQALWFQGDIAACSKTSVHMCSSIFHGLVFSILTHFPVLPSPPDHPQEAGRCLFVRVSDTDTVLNVQKLYLNSQVVQSFCYFKKKKCLHISEVGARSCSTYKNKPISY